MNTVLNCLLIMLVVCTIAFIILMICFVKCVIDYIFESEPKNKNHIKI